MTTTLSHWRFFRAGGFDQVRLDSAAELLSIGTLDQKLWVALACPVTGIEFDARTLAFVDSDADGFVRAPELLAAVAWAGERLCQTEVLVQQLAGVPLASVRSDDAVGQRLLAAARALQADLGSSDDLITVEVASLAQQRFAERARQAWLAAGAQVRPLQDNTEAAYAALLAVQDKVDDWFVRCSLAAFDSRAGDALSAPGEALTALGATVLSADAQAIAALPLARVTANAELALDDGINPAWQERMTALSCTVLAPLLGARATLTASDWQMLKNQWAPYVHWLADKPDPQVEGEGLRDLEKLARYVRDLLPLANNFVAFRNFYARQGKATFQVGTLYLDGRSCDLCVAVTDAAKHASMAALSGICLVYVDCLRGTERLSVAAAFTAGDSDQLRVGRNGVFYDRQGRDWNATISKIIEHPISLRQAFWSPYKRLARLVSDQMQKMAASKAKAADDQMARLAATTANTAGAPAQAVPAATPAPFDVAKFAGIFAAIGLAAGALGTALVSVMTGLFNLKWWQFPLVLAGLMLLVSGPSIAMAWFKLRRRNLGPILDANGWAINARALINLPFGTSLTQLAELPDNAERALSDPYAQPTPPWRLYAVLAAIAALLLAVLAWW